MDCPARKGTYYWIFPYLVMHAAGMYTQFLIKALTVICPLAVCRCTISVHTLGFILEERCG